MLLSNTILRLAKKEDRLLLLPLMISFKEELPLYRDLPTEEESILATIDTYISKINNIDTTVIVSIREDNPIGIIVGTASRLPFNSQIQAAETIWYVLPEYRSTEVGLALYKAFEYWAINKAKASVLHTGAPSGSKLNKVFAKQGYSLLEEVYFKVI